MNATRLLEPGKTSQKRRKPVPVMLHQCPLCTIQFIGVRQKKYCGKPCTEAAFRVRKSALIDALLLEFAPFGANYGLTRAHLERCANADLERCQNIAKTLGWRYDERHKVWQARSHAMLYVV
jgi:hypothetical protein